MPGRIFVCYRREDSAGYAGRICDRLNQHFPSDVFRDVDNIAILQRWKSAIEETLRGCEIGIVLIGARWLDDGAAGTRRIDRDDDPVRRELVALLNSQVEIIPLLVGGATLPPRETLPPDVMAVTDWQALRIDDDDFEHDTGRLIQALEKRLGTAPADVAARTPEPSVAKPAPVREPSAAAVPPADAIETPVSIQDAVQRWKKGGVDEPFLMGIEDIFTIKGRGAVVTGQIRRGRIRSGQRVELVGIRPTRAVTVTGIELSKQLVDEGRAGDECGLLLNGVTAEDLEKGQVVAAPGSMKSRPTFTCSVHLLSLDEGGSAQPVVNGETLQFWVHTIEVDGRVTFRDSSIRLNAGQDQVVTITLSSSLALAKGVVVGWRRNNETIGIGIVLD